MQLQDQLRDIPGVRLHFFLHLSRQISELLADFDHRFDYVDLVMALFLLGQVEGRGQGQEAFPIARLALERHDGDVGVDHQLQGQILVDIARDHIPHPVLVVDDLLSVRGLK